jgi:small-conductance mechanosensitive channel
MNLSKLKLIIFYGVLAAFVACVVVLFVLYRPYVFHGEVAEAPNQFTPLLIKVIGVFAVHIGVMASGYFSSGYQNTSNRATEQHYIAFSLIALWLVGFLVFILLNGLNMKTGETTIEAFNKDIDTVNASINFLIAGALVFLFVTPKKE